MIRMLYDPEKPTMPLSYYVGNLIDFIHTCAIIIIPIMVIMSICLVLFGNPFRNYTKEFFQWHCDNSYVDICERTLTEAQKEQLEKIRRDKEKARMFSPDSWYW